MSQSLSQQYIHIVFSTKNRKPYLQDSNVLKRTQHYIKQVCETLKCSPIAIGGTENHVHLLVNLDRNATLSGLVENVKKSTSKWLKNLRDINPELGRFYWQRGYGAFSVSQSKIDIIKEYIHNQAIHHKKMSFQDEIRALFKKHDIKFDENYLWE